MNNILVLDKKQCFSCHSCVLSCPKNAIRMQESSEGFLYPDVNAECVHCGICVRACPALTPLVVETENIRQSFAAWLQDDDKILQSSSGGAFTGLAEKVIAENGIVFGAAYNDDLSVSQISVDNLNDLQKLKGSKYVESYTGDSFKQVKSFLDTGRTVLYSGTPCQIAGLKSFLGTDYDNLLTVDLVCHGVPSRKLFAKWIEWLEIKTKGKIVYIGFRDKDAGGWSCGGKFKTKTKTKTKILEASLDPYYASFLRYETYRESCYTCPYSSMNRPGDISIGDFFEAPMLYPEIRNLNTAKGISLVVLNNRKGMKFFESIKNQFKLLPVDEFRYVPVKSNLEDPSPRPEFRNSVYWGINEVPTEKFFSRFRESSATYGAIYWLKKALRMVFPQSAILLLKKILRRI